MRLLLDSNVLLWSVSERSRLTRRVLALLEDEGNELFASQASFWELSIKIAKGKLLVPGASVRSFFTAAGTSGITILPITNAAILQTEALPHHHRDPFDRMIIAQALVEELILLSSDFQFPRYGAPVIWR